MNRSRVSLFNKIRKGMSKAIKKARSSFLSPESRKDSETLTANEIQKKFPKKPSRKKINLAKALERKKTVSRKTEKEQPQSGLGKSKRTNPGQVLTQGAPAHTHQPGSRAIKNLNNKIKDQRVIAAHHGSVKK